MVSKHKPICTTEEQAINDFKSTCRKHTKQSNKFPTKLIDIQIQLNFIVRILVRKNKRNKAYLPSFNVMPANIIDPIVGASTCALGSHKCTKNIGIFIKKAIITKKYKKTFKFQKLLYQFNIQILLFIIIIINKGKEPKRV